jgi:hypothetical protein
VLKGGVPKKPKDLVLVHSPTPDGAGVNVLRARKEGLEVGTMRPLEHGRPIHGEVVKLTPRAEMPHLYDAETEFTAPEGQNVAPERKQADAPADRGATTGPAQVASDSYRRNWDVIWKRPAKRLAN